jgi:hypothetical protein
MNMLGVPKYTVNTQTSTSDATAGELPHKICGARICDPSSSAFLPVSLVGCRLSHLELVLLSHLRILPSLRLAPLHTAIWRGDFSPDRGGSTSVSELCTGLLRHRLAPRRPWLPPSYRAGSPAGRLTPHRSWPPQRLPASRRVPRRSWPPPITPCRDADGTQEGASVSFFNVTVKGRVVGPTATEGG